MVWDELGDERAFTVLRLIHESSGPIGSGQIALAMQSVGMEVSEATIGRLLKELETRALLEKSSRRGRVLTPSGKDAYERLALRNASMDRGRALQDILQSADRNHVMQVLEARRPVEGEAAALAARLATSQELDRIERIVERSHLLLSQGTYSAKDDDDFHSAIASASKNRVLETVVRLIRESEGVSRVLMQIRHRVGRKTLVDHESILLGVRSRDPEMARAAMLFHVERVRLDAIQVWAEIDAARKDGAQPQSAASPGGDE